MRRVALLLGAVGVIALGLAASPARAHDGWWGHPDWRENAMQEHAWREQALRQHAWREQAWREREWRRAEWREHHRWGAW